MNLTRILLILPFVFCVACESRAGPRPIIRVGIGMTVDELRVGSTYPFKDGGLALQAAPGVQVHYPSKNENVALHDWNISEPYDLIYTYKGRELRKSDLGGDNYFIAITTAPMSHKIVESIAITFQNRALTLDEALSEAKMLNVWFVNAGFHPLSTSDPEPGRVVGPFHIEEQESSGAPYRLNISSYEGARVAFLDTRSRIAKMTPFELESDDEAIGLTIVNARRIREGGLNDVGHDEGNVQAERTYFLNLEMSARPGGRYEDIH